MRVLDHTTLPFELLDGRRRVAVATPLLGTSSLEVWIETLSPAARGILACGQCSERRLLMTAGRATLLLDGASHGFVAPCSLLLPADVQCEVINEGSDAVQLLVAFSP